MIIDSELASAPALFNLPGKYNSLTQLKLCVGLESTLWWTQIIEYFMNGIVDPGFQTIV
jgi:hypothetical protein